MAEELKFIEKWSLGVNEVIIGADKNNGGTRESIVKVGGEKGLPFLFKEARNPNPPVVAVEVFDVCPDDLPASLKSALGSAAKNPLDLAEKLISETGSEMVCLKLYGTHPDVADKSAKESADLVLSLLKKVKVPLIILGCGNNEKDNEVLPVISEAVKGERLLFGDALQENYKTLTAACIADGHNIIAESPIDVNIAKQLNILISDIGLPLDRIVINPTIGALGYGLEYAYSIMERARNAALSGDKMLAMPFICFVGDEAWRAKEAKVSKDEAPEWGDADKRGIIWEAMTAMAMLQAGAGIMTMRHPEAINIVKNSVKDLCKTQ